MKVFVINKKNATTTEFDNREKAAEYISGVLGGDRSQAVSYFTVVEGNELKIVNDVKLVTDTKKEVIGGDDPRG